MNFYSLFMLIVFFVTLAAGHRCHRGGYGGGYGDGGSESGEVVVIGAEKPKED